MLKYANMEKSHEQENLKSEAISLRLQGKLREIAVKKNKKTFIPINKAWADNAWKIQLIIIVSIWS